MRIFPSCTTVYMKSSAYVNGRFYGGYEGPIVDECEWGEEKKPKGASAGAAAAMGRCRAWEGGLGTQGA